MNRQNILAIDAPALPTLENFVVGDNSELITRLRSLEYGFSGLWLCGENACGKTHLLRGGCVAAVNAGHTQAYLDCAAMSSIAFINSTAELTEKLQSGLDLSVTVAIDHIDALQQESAAEEALMALYNALLDGHASTLRCLMIAHRQPAVGLKFELADLNSRLRALSHYQLQPLSDEDKGDLLRQRASQSGYRLDDAVVDYWLARGPRGLDQLLADLQQLDEATLQQKRLLTVPLLKSVLGY